MTSFAGHDGYLSIAICLALAQARGVSCDVVYVTREVTGEDLVCFTTVDRDPIVTLRGGGRSEDQLLIDRKQSGPDRWDYPIRRESLDFQLAVRLTRGGRSTTIGCLTFGEAHLVQFGWCDLRSDAVPVVVSRMRFLDAIATITDVQCSAEVQTSNDACGP